MRALALVCTLSALLAIPSVARAGDGTAILPLVAEDAQVVGVIDVEDARDAKMFQQGVQQMLAIATDLKDALSLVGLSLADVDTVLVAGNYGSSGTMSHIDQKLMTVIEGGWTKKKVTKLLNGLSGVTTKKKRSIKYWITAYAEVAIIGKRLVVTAPGGMPGVIDRSKKKAKGMTKSAKAAALRTALAYTDTRHDTWMISLPPTQLAGNVRSQLGADLVSHSIGITLGANATLSIHFEVGSATQAADAAKKLQPLINQAKKLASMFDLADFAGSIALSTSGAVLGLDGVMSPAELDKVLELMAMANP